MSTSLRHSERLELFRKVCAAVTYAHQHLVIHRDIKPANIRVTADSESFRERGGEPKLLDFGIAKLLDAENGGDQTLTLQGVMTPEYASPEQVRGGDHDDGERCLQPGRRSLRTSHRTKAVQDRQSHTGEYRACHHRTRTGAPEHG